VHRSAEAPGEAERDPVIAADDAVARKVAEAGRALRQRGDVLILELIAGRDGEPCGDRLPGAGRRDVPLERLGDRVSPGLA